MILCSENRSRSLKDVQTCLVFLAASCRRASVNLVNVVRVIYVESIGPYPNDRTFSRSHSQLTWLMTLRMEYTVIFMHLLYHPDVLTAPIYVMVASVPRCHGCESRASISTKTEKSLTEAEELPPFKISGSNNIPAIVGPGKPARGLKWSR